MRYLDRQLHPTIRSVIIVLRGYGVRCRARPKEFHVKSPEKKKSLESDERIISGLLDSRPTRLSVRHARSRQTALTISEVL